MKTVIIPADPNVKPIEFDQPGEHKVGVNNLGLLVLNIGSETMGIFNPQNIVGIYHPEGHDKVSVVEGLVVGA